VASAVKTEAETSARMAKKIADDAAAQGELARKKIALTTSMQNLGTLKAELQGLKKKAAVAIRATGLANTKASISRSRTTVVESDTGKDKIRKKIQDYKGTEQDTRDQVRSINTVALKTQSATSILSKKVAAIKAKNSIKKAEIEAAKARFVADQKAKNKLKKAQHGLSSIQQSIKDAILVEKAQAAAAAKASAAVLAKVKKTKDKFDAEVKDEAAKLSDAHDARDAIALKVAKEKGEAEVAAEKLSRAKTSEGVVDATVEARQAEADKLASQLKELKMREAKLVAAKLHSLENNGETANPTVAMDKMSAANDLRNKAMETTAKMVNSAKP